MSSSLVRTGFVRGSTTQGNGCFQHRCVNNTLEVELYMFSSSSTGTRSTGFDHELYVSNWFGPALCHCSSHMISNLSYFPLFYPRKCRMPYFTSVLPYLDGLQQAYPWARNLSNWVSSGCIILWAGAFHQFYASLLLFFNMPISMSP